MYVNPLFRDRNEAGQVLGQRLKSVVRDSNVIVRRHKGSIKQSVPGH